ncbi:MAG TPA: LD-carboxypeptidase [Allosphingosinicella sp.]|nr:LD-carboxypeptidase [Allosphingosinicella sp.]
MRIAVVAPSSCFDDEAQVRETERRVRHVAAEHHPGADIVFHDQCADQAGHFAGADDVRAAALVAVANDPAYDAIWFARGGYGSNRIAERALAGFDAAARRKKWLGYSDAGFLLAGLYREGYAGLAHGPMPKDALRADGAEAVKRALDWLVDGSRAALAEEVDRERPNLAFNITVFGMLLGTPLQPPLAGHVLMLEDVDEHLYATDRAMFHITRNAAVREVAGIRRGRIAVKADRDQRPFGETAQAIFERWCGEAGIALLGTADIGHDSDNKIVPFGRL